MDSGSFAVRLLFATLACLLFVQQGAALRCWVCSSSTDQRCRDPFNSTQMQQVDCERHRAVAGYGDRAYCQKTVTSISGGERKVVRKCVFSRDALEGACFDQPQSSDYLTVEHCSTCTEDACNAGPPARRPAAHASVLAAVSALAAAWGAAHLLH